MPSGWPTWRRRHPGPTAASTLEDDRPRTRRSVIPDVRHAVRIRRIARLLLAGCLLAACSAGDDAASGVAPADVSATPTAGAPEVRVVAPGEAVELVAEAGTTVIDVRTPDEYAAGHVAGALNIDVQADTFDDRVAELDRDGSYVVYCRTGSRSAAAAARMAELGFTGVVDAGAFDDLVDAGATEETG